MDEILNSFMAKIAEGIERYFTARIFPRFEKFFRTNIELCFSEEEAAKLLKMEKSTLAEKRKNREINFYQYGKSATYGLHHLQDYMSRHEVKNIPQIFTVKTEISLLGTETESKPRRLAS